VIIGHAGARTGSSAATRRQRGAKLVECVDVELAEGAPDLAEAKIHRLSVAMRRKNQRSGFTRRMPVGEDLLLTAIPARMRNARAFLGSRCSLRSRAAALLKSRTTYSTDCAIININGARVGPVHLFTRSARASPLRGRFRQCAPRAARSFNAAADGARG
jgi:hypothetical protein